MDSSSFSPDGSKQLSYYGIDSVFRYKHLIFSFFIIAFDLISTDKNEEINFEISTLSHNIL